MDIMDVILEIEEKKTYSPITFISFCDVCSCETFVVPLASDKWVWSSTTQHKHQHRKREVCVRVCALFVFLYANIYIRMHALVASLVPQTPFGQVLHYEASVVGANNMVGGVRQQLAFSVQRFR